MSDDTSLSQFVQLSAILTGIDQQMLAPKIDPLNIKQDYFSWLQSHAADVFTLLLARYAALQAENTPPDKIATAILTQSGAPIGNLARSVMLMWYIGSWYPPSDPANYATPGSQPSPSVISANAYTQGKVWSVAQAHPMGYSQLRFGYWAENPAPLADFVGNGGTND